MTILRTNPQICTFRDDHPIHFIFAGISHCLWNFLRNISAAKLDSTRMQDKGYLSPKPTKKQNTILGLCAKITIIYCSKRTSVVELLQNYSHLINPWTLKLQRCQLDRYQKPTTAYNYWKVPVRDWSWYNLCHAKMTLNFFFF